MHSAWLHGLPKRDVTRYCNDGDPAFGDRRLNRNLQRARHLLRFRDEFAVVTALCEEMLRICFLEVVASDFRTGNLRGDRQNRNPAPMTIVESVDQMEISGAAATRTHSELSGKMRF